MKENQVVKKGNAIALIDNSQLQSKKISGRISYNERKSIHNSKC
ncbi:hypothetical protein [Nostoc sp.]